MSRMGIPIQQAQDAYPTQRRDQRIGAAPNEQLQAIIMDSLLYGQVNQDHCGMTRK